MFDKEASGSFLESTLRAMYFGQQTSTNTNGNVCLEARCRESDENRAQQPVLRSEGRGTDQNIPEDNGTNLGIEPESMKLGNIIWRKHLFVIKDFPNHEWRKIL